MPDEPIGARIAKRRHVLGLKQWQLAERVGVARDTVSLWERDQQKPQRHLGKLEQVLGISLSQDADPDEAEFYELLDRLRDNPLTEGIDLRPLEQAFEQRKRRGRHARMGGASEMAS